MKTNSRLGFAMTLVLALGATASFGQGFTGSLRDLSGGAVGADQLRGRVTVLLFGGIVDPQSPEELPALQQLSERYADRNVQVVWVSLDTEGQVTGAALSQYAKQNGFGGRVLRDPGGQVLASLSAGRRPQLPTVIVLDSAGALATKPIGGFDREGSFVNRLTKIIDPLL